MKHKKILNTLILLLTAALVLGCEESTGPDNSEDPKPPGYQEEIPWPSLADSPWPMHHHDPQSSGRSKLIGPMIGKVDWKMDSISTETGVSVGEDSTLYFISYSQSRKGLIALNPDGSIKWIQKDINVNTKTHTTPLVDNNNNIYIGNGIAGEIIKLNSNGDIDWRFQAEGMTYQFKINIGINGNIYFLANNVKSETSYLYSTNSSGELNGRVENEKFNSSESSGISFSPDGKTLYIPGYNPSIFSFDIINQTINWSFGEVRIPNSPLVDSDGNIYLHSVVDSINGGKPSWFSLKPDGNIRWYYSHNHPDFRPTSYAEGTIDKNGNTYFAFDTLYSINYKGELRWKLPLNGYSGGPLICDGNNNIYTNIGSNFSIVSISNDGIFNWTLYLNNGQILGSYPCITYSNKLINPTWQSNYIYSIR